MNTQADLTAMYLLAGLALVVNALLAIIFYANYRSSCVGKSDVVPQVPVLPLGSSIVLDKQEHNIL